jgi:hypothetical protein
MNHDTRRRSTHVTSCSKLVCFSFKNVLSFVTVFSSLVCALQPLGGAQDFREPKTSPTPASSITPGKMEEVSKERQRHRKCPGLSISAHTKRLELNYSKRSRPFSLCLFCFQLFIHPLEYLLS